MIADLYNVGKTKAVGYLPIKTIKIYENDTIENVIKCCDRANKTYKIFSEKECFILSGALFVYDTYMLKCILDQYEYILQKENIPTTPDEYIDFIAKNIVFEHELPEIYRIICLTFNDSRFVNDIHRH